MTSSSKPITRDSLHAGFHPVPPPKGCEHCNLSDFCGHFGHFLKIKEALENRGCPYLGSGSYRSTYESKNKRWVYKVPKEADGYRDNYFEALAWKERKNLYSSGGQHIGDRVARCRMLPNGVLVMERLRKPGHYCHGPDDIDTTLRDDPVRDALGKIDGCQGGLNRENVFQLYDFTHFVTIQDPITPGLMAL